VWRKDVRGTKGCSRAMTAHQWGHRKSEKGDCEEKKSLRRSEEKESRQGLKIIYKHELCWWRPHSNRTCNGPSRGQTEGREKRQKTKQEEEGREEERKGGGKTKERNERFELITLRKTKLMHRKGKTPWLS